MKTTLEESLYDSPFYRNSKSNSLLKLTNAVLRSITMKII